MRKLSSLYLSEIFPFIPFARRRLLSPFRDQLGPRPELITSATGENWFPEVEVTERLSDKRIPISDALPVIRGLTILEGASGLGKTVYLVRLALNSKRLIAFLQAGEEGGDVAQAIAARLPGEVMRDRDFLRSLIYAGGLDICIDGLNEVSADTRGTLIAFARSMSKANILISTQPFRWELPQGARLLRLLPLRLDQAGKFLATREPILPADAPIRGEEYLSQVQAFLEGSDKSQPEASERQARDRALSNPMDLTTVALILARGGKPDLLNLQETAFKQAAAAYRDQNQGAAFPLQAFAEYVYRRRAEPTGPEKDRLVLSDPNFAQECGVLADYRLLLYREEADEEGKNQKVWIFRHDKILDFFLYTAVADEEVDETTRAERVLKHIDDPRFRGMFLLMASRTSLDFAAWLRVRIADRAAETRDHVLSDQFWSTVRQRLGGEAANDTSIRAAALIA